ncbi:MAG: lysophospholipid acyltransferase family protein [Pseudorhodoplanes sp.]
MIIVRSVVFNVLFYLVLAVYLIAALPTLAMPRGALLWMVRSWARTNFRMLRAICNIGLEFRGFDRLPPGPLLVASKHQSLWETFALMTAFSDPAFILKRELMWIPFFGWCASKAEMIPVDRGARSAALARMTEQAKIETGRGRQIVIFPEGTRRAPGAEPKYKYGVVHLYSELGVPCAPLALNSGLFWPRRSFRRYPGTIKVEACEPIAPGLDKETFFRRLQEEVETTTARLVAEGERERASLTG